MQQPQARHLATAVLLGAALFAGCAAPPRPSVLTGGGPPPPATPAPSRPAPVHPADPGTTSGAGATVVATADTYLGLPYRYGGEGPEGYDCSGLVQSVFRKHGLRLPRTCAEQEQWGRPVERDALRPGDLVFFGERGEAPSHVGIYEGEGAFIHASAGRGEVRRDHLDAPWFRTRYASARRLLEAPLP